MDPAKIELNGFDWPHAPVHRLTGAGAYMITAGTYQKQRFFPGHDRLGYVRTALFAVAREHGLRLQAWAIFPNHYHIVAESDQPSLIIPFIRYLHSVSAKYVNRLDETPARKVWHQYWDTHLTHEKSFLARLNYVHTNAAKHKVVSNPELYEWCSASWFARTTTRSFYTTVMSFPSDKVLVPDDYDTTV